MVVVGNQPKPNQSNNLNLQTPSFTNIIATLFGL